MFEDVVFLDEHIAFCFDWLRELGFVYWSELSVMKNGFTVSFDPAFEFWTIENVFSGEFGSYMNFNQVLVEVRRLKLT